MFGCHDIAAAGLIKRLDLEGFTNEKVVIATGLTNPRGIVLDPLADMMYFTDVSRSNPNIQRASMGDGTGQEVIISEDLGRPNAITMDYDTNVSISTSMDAGRVYTPAHDTYKLRIWPKRLTRILDFRPPNPPHPQGKYI